jgi:hypothetical protein
LPLSNQQVRAVYAVRAALLRSAIALIAAILDTAGRDRASLGRVVQIMGHGAEFVANVGPHNSVLKSEKLRYVCDRYHEIYRRDDYQRLLQLRHDELGHLLVRDTPTPISERSELHALSDAIKELVTDLHAGLGMEPPVC